MSALTVQARDMASQENADGEEFDMIQKLADKLDEIELYENLVSTTAALNVALMQENAKLKQHVGNLKAKLQLRGST